MTQGIVHILQIWGKKGKAKDFCIHTHDKVGGKKSVGVTEQTIKFFREGPSDEFTGVCSQTEFVSATPQIPVQHRSCQMRRK